MSTASRRGGELLERERELTLLAEWLDAVRQESKGRVVLVAGEAGGGKTAVLRRLCDRHRRTARILWGSCDTLFTPRPLGPFLDVAQTCGGELDELVRRGATPHDVASAYARELRSRAPTILVLEDVHSADGATLDVLRLLGRRVESIPAPVLASYRDTELPRFHPLRLVLGELASGGAVEWLRLLPLSPDAVRELAEPHETDPAELYRKTGGNPFFVTEALAAGGEEIPASVQDAVLARAARLAPNARLLLEAVAIASPWAELRLLEALVPDALGELGNCLASGMLVDESGTVRFRHELARLAIEEVVAPDRRLELHRAALRALTGARAGVAPDPARLAYHAEGADDPDAVLRFAPAAAARASSLGAHREAAAQYARAGDAQLARARARGLGPGGGHRRPRSLSALHAVVAAARIVLALVRARRGDPDPWTPLDDADRVAQRTGQLWWTAPLALADRRARVLAPAGRRRGGHTRSRTRAVRAPARRRVVPRRRALVEGGVPVRARWRWRRRTTTERSAAGTPSCSGSAHDRRRRSSRGACAGGVPEASHAGRARRRAPTRRADGA